MLSVDHAASHEDGIDGRNTPALSAQLWPRNARVPGRMVIGELRPPPQLTFDTIS